MLLCCVPLLSHVWMCIYIYIHDDLCCFPRGYNFPFITPPFLSPQSLSSPLPTDGYFSAIPKKSEKEQGRKVVPKKWRYLFARSRDQI